MLSYIVSKPEIIMNLDGQPFTCLCRMSRRKSNPGSSGDKQEIYSCAFKAPNVFESKFV